MPTYYALGITASLTVADLKTTLSRTIDLKMGSDCQKDAKRIAAVFAGGRKLEERPIGPHADDKFVQSFIGDAADLPLYMVEAGDRLVVGSRVYGARNVDDHASEEMETGEEMKISEAMERNGVVETTEGMEMGEDMGTGEGSETSSLTSFQASEPDSPLSVLSKTPSAPNTPHRASHARGKTDAGQAHPKADSSSTSVSSNAPIESDKPTGPQALCLNIETNQKSFLPSANTGNVKVEGRDLKFEVFINGQLAGVSFVNKRLSAVEFDGKKGRFNGTRCHRQIEMPWVYDPNVVCTEEGQKRWFAIQRDIRTEATVRGRNLAGQRAPSGEFLCSLARMPIPAHLKGHPNMGVIDIVVTSGRGMKDGPQMGYITEPTRLRDPGFSHEITLTSLVESGMVFTDESEGPARELNTSPFKAKTGFAGASHNRQHFLALPVTPSKPRDVDLGLNFDISDPILDREVGAYENARGTIGKPRNLRQRLSDIRQMNAVNREKQMAALCQELGEAYLRGLKKDPVQAVQEVADESEMQPSSTKKRKFVEDLDFGLNLLANAALADEAGTLDRTIDPMKLFHGPPPPCLLREGADPQVSLTQQRIDMALDAGLSSEGPLINHITSCASLAPQCSPPKQTRASALAHSPCRIPVKEQLRPGRKPDSSPTPHDSSVDDDISGPPILIDPRLSPSPPKRPILGANTTGPVLNPGEKSPQRPRNVPGTAKGKGKANMKEKDTMKGSVVGHAEGPDMQRQVGKARFGEFREESFVVGMRFILI